MNPIGYATLIKSPVKTKYHWGDISEIAGKEMPVLDRNENGDCLCLVEDKGLVDVESIDIASYRTIPDMGDYLLAIVSGLESIGLNAIAPPIDPAVCVRPTTKRHK